MESGKSLNLWKIVILICVLCIYKVVSKQYEDYKMYRVVAHGRNELLFTQALFKISDNYDIEMFRPAKLFNQTLLFLVPKMYVNQIESLLQTFRIIPEQLSPQMQRKDGKVSHFEDEIDLQNVPFDENVIKRKYLTYSESVKYVDMIVSKIQRNNPNVVAKTETIGFSYQKRKIRATTLQYKNKGDNPIILIDALIHARERHSGSMALYTLKSLADEATKGVDGILFKATFVIINMLNPDGYEYNLEHEPFWRKTRKPSVQIEGCFGVDGNRNFDVHWNQGQKEKLPCDETYRGLSPFSETETQALRYIMLALREKIKMYISIHSFGNTILYPYGFTTDKHPRIKEIHAVAEAGAQAVFAATGSTFIPGQSGSQLYVAAGGSDDYADSIGIPFAYTFELGAEKYGKFAVDLDKIEATIKEGWIVIRAMVEKVLTM